MSRGVEAGAMSRSMKMELEHEAGSRSVHMELGTDVRSRSREREQGVRSGSMEIEIAPLF